MASRGDSSSVAGIDVPDLLSEPPAAELAAGTSIATRHGIAGPGTDARVAISAPGALTGSRSQELSLRLGGHDAAIVLDVDGSLEVDLDQPPPRGKWRQQQWL
jgi:hypothetical protein